jgi:hypothetical protein
MKGCTDDFLVEFVVAALKCLLPFAKTISYQVISWKWVMQMKQMWLNDIHNFELDPNRLCFNNQLNHYEIWNHCETEC